MAAPRRMRRILWMTLVVLLGSCGDRGKISERHARATAETLIATQGPQMRDFHRMEWRKFEQVSPTEARGTAVLVYRFPLPNGGTGEEQIEGKFIYHKTDKGWALDYIDFPNPNNLFHSVSRQAYEKVTSARVAARNRPSDSSTRPSQGPEPTASDLPDSGEARASNQSEPVVAPSSARRAAQKYLASVPLQGEKWRARDFGPFARLGGGGLELPATLVAESNQGVREYHGAFYFDFKPDIGNWVLTRMAFQAEGLAPIEQEIRPPIPVR